jgi:hypothetical protein
VFKNKRPPLWFVIFKETPPCSWKGGMVRSPAWQMYNNQIINYMTKSLSKILLERMSLEKMLNYKFESSFWEEFSIAEDYGPEGIHHHYDIVFEQYKDNLKYLTELVLVLNIKIFIWYGVDDTIGKMYDQLWKETDSYALETLKGDDLHYYLSTLD